jgi:hypothetical protein
MAAESFLFGIASFVLFMLVFIALQRANLKIGWFSLIILTGILIHILASIAGLIFFPGFSYWYSTSIYAFLWFCFFFVCSIYSVSVSLGIINYLYRKPDKTAPLQQIYNDCIKSPFQERADFLVSSGQAIRIDEKYISSPAGNRTARWLKLINKTLGMEIHGYYSKEPAEIK